VFIIVFDGKVSHAMDSRI